MGIFNVLDPVLDAVLGPLTRLPPALGILIITFFISLAIVLIYKFTTDQVHMKALRAKIKKHQEEMKTLRNDPEQMMKVQKKAMAVNTELMKHSMRPTLYTMVPIIIIFGWLASHFSVVPIMPDTPFNVSVTASGDATGTIGILIPDGIELLSPADAPIVDRTASWTLKGKQGVYEVFFDFNGEQLKKRVVISDEHGIYAKAIKTHSSLFDFIYSSREGSLPSGSQARSITVAYDTVRPLPFSIFGWRPGWLGTYIIFSLLFSMALRKLLKVA
jgi:uncharacterized membrane protein (DUF106 family)